MKFLGFDKVLCLSPHPDDVEFSLAGTILKHNSTSFDLICLSQGGDYDETTSTGRLEEVSRSWEVPTSYNYNLYFTSYKFVKELEEDEWISYIEKEFISKKNYDAIISPSCNDSHFEHRQTCRIGRALARTQPLAVIEYRSPSTSESWTPNLFVDIEHQFSTKLLMLGEFKSQLHRSYFREKVIRDFHNNFQCSKKGMSLVEQFYVQQLFLK